MRTVALDNLHTGEKMEAVYWADGDYIPDVLDAVNVQLRDFRTGDIHPIAPELLDLLDAVNTLTGTQSKFEVISGYRSAATNAMLRERSEEVAKKSFHMSGMAIDIRLPDVDLDRLHAAALSLGPRRRRLLPLLELCPRRRGPGPHLVRLDDDRRTIEMAREGGGGGGAFLWTILGMVVGVAGTLAVETLMSHHETATEPAPTSAAVAVVTPPAPAPRVDPAPVAPPPSAAPAVASTDTSQLSHEDVQDDAAAAGMTSRSRTGDAELFSAQHELNHDPSGRRHRIGLPR